MNVTHLGGIDALLHDPRHLHEPLGHLCVPILTHATQHGPRGSDGAPCVNESVACSDQTSGRTLLRVSPGLEPVMRGEPKRPPGHSEQAKIWYLLMLGLR